MAILRNREVNYLGRVSGHDSSAPVRVEDKYGNIEIVKMSELRFTEDEIEDMKEYETHQLSGLATISDKELKELRDSQDAEKIDQEQNKNVVKAQQEYDRNPVQITARPDTTKPAEQQGIVTQNTTTKKTK